MTLLQAAKVEPSENISGSEGERYRLFTARDALEPLPPIDWVIENLIPVGTVTLVFGDAGSKKTFAMADAAVCVALGKQWLDFPTVQGPVLFVDEEMGGRYIRERINISLLGHFGDAETPFFYTSLAGFDLGIPEDVEELHRLILFTGARLVVIDALIDVMPGRDENSTKDTGPIFRSLKQAAATTGAAILVIHHANKNGGYRGSTAIKGGVDLMLKVESSQGSNIVTFDTEKPRMIARTTFAARAVWGEGEFYLVGVDTSSAEFQYLGKAQEYVIRWLAGNGPSEMVDIMGHADTTSENGARQAVYALAKLKMVERIDRGGPGTKAIYDLTETGRAWAERAGFDFRQVSD